jgi:hypothetical protein
LNGRVRRLESDLAREPSCLRCSGVVLCIDTDGEPLNSPLWQEYEDGCPVCGAVPPTLRVVWDEEQEE